MDADRTLPVDPDETRTFSAPAGGSADQPGEWPQIHGYCLKARLGEGGMGVVWRAEQLATRRVVALKLMSAAWVGSAKALARFEREVELAASLEHDNIARVYDGGRSGSVCFYAMELVDGLALDRHVANEGLDRRGIVELMARLCRAVQVAHQRGIIHRDLKPSNVMVTAAGIPKLLDFGLAKTIDAGSAAVSMAGDISGTVAYMSPEQARGESDRLDTRSDVYSLGVMLFALVTGTLPHAQEGTVVTRLRRVAEEPARRPRAVCPSIDAELEVVLLKALSSAADERYASAGEFADDLGRYLAGEPLLARPHTVIYLLGRAARRYRWWVAGAATAVAALATGVGVYIHNINAAETVARNAQTRAETQRQVADFNALRAEEQRAVALSTVKDLVYAAQRELKDLPGQHEARQRLLDLATTGLAKIAAGAKENKAEIDRTSAGALAQIGDIFVEAGETDRAREAYEEAARRLELLGNTPVANRAAAPAAWRHDLLVVRSRSARLLLSQGNANGSRRAIDAAWAALREDQQARPLGPGLARDEWSLRVLEGDFAMKFGPLDAAEGEYRKALTLIDEAREWPEGVEGKRHDRDLTTGRLGHFGNDRGANPTKKP